MGDMPALVHQFDWPDRVVVGTVGRPGSRTFYLQVRDGARSASVALEKEQSAVLAEKIDEILDALMADDGNRFSVPAATPAELVDNDPLDQPVEEQFRAGLLRLGWDPSTAQVVVEAFPLDESASPTTRTPSRSPARCSWSGCRSAPRGRSSSAPGRSSGRAGRCARAAASRSTTTATCAARPAP